MIPPFYYDYPDNSKLIRAWEKYYSDMGCSATKIQLKVTQRVFKGRYPK